MAIKTDFGIKYIYIHIVRLFVFDIAHMDVYSI